MDDIPEIGDEADSPIIVPPPGQILRRAARTKIRKPSLPGDGGGHRFGSHRRGIPKRAQTSGPESRTSSDKSSSDHGDSLESSSADHRRRTFSDERNQRPDSFAEEAQIFDAYTYNRDDYEEASSSGVLTSPSPALIELPDIIEQPPDIEQPPQLEPLQPLSPTGISASLFEALGPIISPPLPEHLTIPVEVQVPPRRTPSPPPEPSPAAKQPTPPHVHPSFLSTPPSPPQQQRKDKDKRSLFGIWGSDKGSKKAPKEKEKDRENRERIAEKEKEKDSSFFGSLFGAKKKPDDSPPHLLPNGISGREAAQAILGPPKSKTFAASISPGFSAGIGPNSYARYPIHVERAIYRLSHIKLANPRRPLYEQVLISNLMFWYLGVINKAQVASPPNGHPNGAQAPVPAAGPPAEQGDPENERKEKEQHEKERLERERLEKEHRDMENKKRESGRRGSLTKASAHGTPGGGRRAEIPVRGPQYEMQHQVMEQEYSGYSGQPGVQMGRSTSAPVGGGSSQYSRSPEQPQTTQANSAQMQGPSHTEDYIYYSTDQRQQRLPPGAMPVDQFLWQQSSASPSQDGPLTSNPGRYKNLNTSQNNLVSGGGSERLPGRSLSANAVPAPSQEMNGRPRKGMSAHAALASPARRPRSSEGRQDVNSVAEEDMPLAMWQQARRR